MPSTTDLLTLTLVLTATAAVGAANHDGRKVRRLRRGSHVTQIDNLNAAVPIKKTGGGLEEDVEFWTNMVRKTQYMSLPPVPGPTPSLPPVGSGTLPPVVVEPPTSSLPPVSSEPPVVVEPPTSSLPPVASEPPVVVEPPTSSLPPVASEPPVVVEPPTSSLPPVASEPPVVVEPPTSSLPPVSSEPPVVLSTPPVAAPVPSMPPVASEPPVVVSEPPVVVSEPPVMSSSPPVAGGAFICPDASFVGCTAVDPTNPEDECTTVGEPCPNGQDGEYCCLDGCPRNYCTAKQAPMMTTAQLSEVEMFVAPLPTDF